MIDCGYLSCFPKSSQKKTRLKILCQKIRKKYNQQDVRDAVCHLVYELLSNREQQVAR